MAATVDMRLERHPIGVDLPESRQRHDLKAAGVGQDGARPIHEAVQPAERRNPVGARPQHKMVCVCQNALTPSRPHRIGRHRFDCSGGSDCHEGRCLHRAVSRLQDAGAGQAVEGLELKAEPGWPIVH